MGEGVTEQPLDYDEMRAVCEKATAGPWRHRKPGIDGTIHQIEQAVEGASFARFIARCEDTGYTREASWQQRSEDAEFIAKSREWVPALLAECEARTKEVAELRESNRALAMENVALAAKLQTLRHAIESRYEQEEWNRGAAS